MALVFTYDSVRKTRELVVGDAKPAARKAKKSGVMKCISDFGLFLGKPTLHIGTNSKIYS